MLLGYHFCSFCFSFGSNNLLLTLLLGLLNDELRPLGLLLCHLLGLHRSCVLTAKAQVSLELNRMHIIVDTVVYLERLGVGVGVGGMSTGVLSRFH